LVNDYRSTRKVGVVTFGQLENWNPEINSYIGEASLVGFEIEKKAVELAIEWLKERGYMKLHTTVPDTNEKWGQILTDLGFTNVGKARNGESTWEKYISDIDDTVEYVTGRILL